MKTAVKYLGPSRDGRTNRWRITCSMCSTSFEPPTTMHRYQIVQCPRCCIVMHADYNTDPPTVTGPTEGA